MTTIRLILFSLPVFTLLNSCNSSADLSTVADANCLQSLSAPAGTPLVTDKALYVGDFQGYAYKIEIPSGVIQWCEKIGGSLAFPPIVAAAQEIVIFPDTEGSLSALNLASGDRLWDFSTGEVNHQVRDVFVNGTPALWQDRVIFSSEDFNLYALDVATGEELWRYTLAEEPQARSVPIDSGIAYLGAWDGYLYAINADTGTLVWKSATDVYHQGSTVRGNAGDLVWVPDNPQLSEIKTAQAPYVTAVPIIRDGIIYFADWTGKLFAVSQATGEQLWKFTPDTPNIRRAGPADYLAIFDDIIYYGSANHGHVFGVSTETGQEVWKHDFGTTVYGPSNLNDQLALILLESASGDIVGQIWDMTATPEFLWELTNASFSPHVFEDALFVGMADRSIKRFDIKTGKETWRCCAGDAGN